MLEDLKTIQIIDSPKSIDHLTKIRELSHLLNKETQNIIKCLGNENN